MRKWGRGGAALAARRPAFLGIWIDGKSLSAVHQRREGLVDEEAEDCVNQALAEGEGQIEDDQALQQAVGRGQDGLVHPDDGLDEAYR